MESVKESLNRLKPVQGRIAEGLWKRWMVEDEKGKKEIETLLPLLENVSLGRKYEPDICLVPPSPEQAKGEYEIGTVIYGGKPFCRFGFREKELLSHSVWVGITGFGKTTGVHALLHTLNKNGKPWLILDMKKNFRSLAIERDDVKVFTLGKKEVSPFYFNPLIPPDGTPPDLWLKKIIECIESSYFVGQGVGHFLQRALDALYRKYGVYEGNVTYWPTFRDVEDWMKENLRTYRGRQSLWYASCTRVLSSLTFGGLGGVLNSHKSADIKSILSQRVIIECDFLGQEDFGFFVKTLLLWIYFHKLNQGKKSQLENMVIIEEAQNVLNRPKSEKRGGEDSIDLICRTIRELGTGLVFVSQNASLLNIQSLGNSFATFAFNSKHERDVSTLAPTLLLAGEQISYLGRLPVGVCIVKLQDRYPHPFLVKFDNLKGEYSVSDDEIKRRMGSYSDKQRQNHTYSEKREDIWRWPHSDDLLNYPDCRLAQEPDIFLVDIDEHPFSPLVERYERLGFSSWLGNKYKTLLLKHRLIKEVPVATRSSRVLLFELTDAGKERLKYLGYRLKHPLVAGIVHELWKARCAGWLKDAGWKVQVEKDGRDIVGEKDGKKIVVEIETGKSDIEANLSSAVALKPGTLCFVGTNSEAKDKVAKALVQFQDEETPCLVFEHEEFRRWLKCS